MSFRHSLIKLVVSCVAINFSLAVADGYQVDPNERIASVRKFFGDLRGQIIHYQSFHPEKTVPYATSTVHVGLQGEGIFFNSHFAEDSFKESESLFHADDTFLVADARRDAADNRELTKLLLGGERWKATSKYRGTSSILFGTFSDGQDIFDLTLQRVYEDGTITEPDEQEIAVQFPSGIQFRFGFEGSDSTLSKLTVDTRSCKELPGAGLVVHEFLRDETGKFSGWQEHHTYKNGEVRVRYAIKSIAKWKYDAEKGFKFETMSVPENMPVQVVGRERAKYVHKNGRFEAALKEKE